LDTLTLIFLDIHLSLSRFAAVARSENKVLNQMVKELSLQVRTLTAENQALSAEVEMYRKEVALPNFSSLALGTSHAQRNEIHAMEVDTDSFFIKSGDGKFPTDCAVTLQNLHGNFNILCCALNPDDTILATGGADSTICLSTWGAALSPSEGAADRVVQGAIRLTCPGPVICVAFAQSQGTSMSTLLPVVAAG
jgi:hypothetical protein